MVRGVRWEATTEIPAFDFPPRLFAQARMTASWGYDIMTKQATTREEADSSASLRNDK
jgi:hypothetical protein